MEQGEFRDARLVSVYDAENLWSRDDDFFFAVVNETPRARVLDLGCGTGRLALGLAEHGHTVTGVDPARASLDAARAKPGATAVEWIEGTASSLPVGSFDVAVMTSHVAQFFLDDGEWSLALTRLHRALVPGGRLVFDTRNPAARDWERWNPVESRRRVVLADQTTVEVWTELDSIDSGLVRFTRHYAFADGEKLSSTATLRFRGEEEIRAALLGVGFSVETIYGGWRRQPVGPGDDGEFLVVARS